MDPLNLNKETLTVAEAAKVCGVNRVTMWRWVKANDLPATTTVGGHHRIRKSDLSFFMTANHRAGGRCSKNRILIVDDDAHIQKLMRRTLERKGNVVETCSNGFEAGIRVMRFRPHLIVLDLFMPHMDGFQVCRQLKGDPETATIKIITISGRASPANIDAALRCGADLFLKKPFDKVQLVDQVAFLLNPQPVAQAAPYD